MLYIILFGVLVAMVLVLLAVLSGKARKDIK
jgi:hypothetical protein